MDFLVKDLIKPNNYPNFDNFTFHSDLVNIFKNSGILFDTLLRGTSGSGKTTLFLGYLQKIFGISVLNLVPNSENKNTDLSFNLERVGVPLSNNNLVIINDSVNDETLYNFLTNQFDILGDNLNYIMILHLERFKDKTISCITNFIENRKSRTYILATTNHYDKLTSRTKSRFETFNVSRPSLNELVEYYDKLIPSKFQFPKDKITKIIESTNRCMKLSIIYINQRLLESIDSNLKKKSIDNFKYYIGCLLQMILKNDIKGLPAIRTMILTLYQSSLTWNEFLDKTLDLLFNSITTNVKGFTISDQQKVKILSRTADLDHKVSLTKPTYIHYEAFIFMIYEILFAES